MAIGQQNLKNALADGVASASVDGLNGAIVLHLSGIWVSAGRVMRPLQLEFEATVYWVGPSQARYADGPSTMRRFRSLNQAIDFVVRSLPKAYRQDARILTADRALMYDEIFAMDATLSQKQDSDASHLSRRFGAGAAGFRVNSRKV